jgi:L-serine dehydratase
MFLAENTEGAQHSSGANRLLELRLMDAFKPRSVKIADAPLSVTDLYTIGIGPSSSHTVGPMKAASMFAHELVAHHNNAPARILLELFGSLALTGKGHRTDIAVILGLMGWMPETVDPGSADALVGEVERQKHFR